MIFVSKPKDIPEILTTKGVTTNTKNCAKYAANPNDYISSTKKISIHPKIYGHKSVKKVLKKAQHSKCCFCEKKQTDEYGAVEHYRPKSGYKKSRTSTLLKPGYYWVGYNWDNLYFVCSSCNTFKGNIFPLRDENRRATSHNHNIANETPYILNPSTGKDPRNHIYFEKQLIKSKTKFGSETINACALDRESLNDERKEFIDDIDARLVILSQKMQFDNSVVIKAEEFIKNAISPKSQFSAMAKDYLDLIGVILV